MSMGGGCERWLWELVVRADARERLWWWRFWWEVVLRCAMSRMTAGCGGRCWWRKVVVVGKWW